VQLRIGDSGTGRDMKITFVNPTSHAPFEMDDFEPPQLPGPRGDVLDLKANKQSSGVPLVRPRNGGKSDWMD
jgi:hypothetical protein